MLASQDKDLIDHAQKLSQQARDPAPWYEHTEIGFNYRWTIHDLSDDFSYFDGCNYFSLSKNAYIQNHQKTQLLKQSLI